MNNQQYTSQQPDSEQEKEGIEELAETSRNDGEDESEDSDNDIIEIDNTMNEVFGELF